MNINVTVKIDTTELESKMQGMNVSEKKRIMTRLMHESLKDVFNEISIGTASGSIENAVEVKDDDIWCDATWVLNITK